MDLKRDSPTPRPLVIIEEEVVIVGEYKYLGSIVDAKSDLSPNALALRPKGNQRHYFMERLKSFSVCSKLLELFHRSTVVKFNSFCHFTSLKEQDRAGLSKVTKTASRLTDRPVPNFHAHFEPKMVRRLEAIHCEPNTPSPHHSPAVCRAADPHLIRSGRLNSFWAKSKPAAVCFSNIRGRVGD